MKPLRRLLDSVHPLFDKGGKFERLYPLYEGLDTFLYTPADVTPSASHIRDGMDLKRMMITVVIALKPCILMALWNTGYQANLVMQKMGVAVDPTWRGDVMGITGLGYAPGNMIACIVHGLSLIDI